MPTAAVDILLCLPAEPRVLPALSPSMHQRLRVEESAISNGNEKHRGSCKSADYHSSVNHPSSWRSHGESHHI
ncbi:unnamed protein product [Periconia digitata]|uniref:Uncharacterized protein n=1 Tax=Periconia digitata TaxID=1303443 RepID=A0A9W4U702_9PLEO|nr:unnamed protein product [Periconia digitata]